MEIQKRQVAYKVWISDLINGNYVKGGGEFEPNYIETKNKKISRVNLIATVVFRFDGDNKEYSSITLDDGSGTIRVKAWRDDLKIIENIKVGDLVLMIGRARSYNDETYISPEIIKVLDDPNWELARKLELLKEHGKPGKVENAIFEKQEAKVETAPESSNTSFEEEVVQDENDGARQKILNFIELNGTEEGVKFEEAVKESGVSAEEAEKYIQELLREGEIYESRPNRLKVLG